jgi:hypothetical protein
LDVLQLLELSVYLDSVLFDQVKETISSSQDVVSIIVEGDHVDCPGIDQSFSVNNLIIESSLVHVELILSLVESLQLLDLVFLLFFKFGVQLVLNQSHLFIVLSLKPKVGLLLLVLEFSNRGFTIFLFLWNSYLISALLLATEPIAVFPASYPLHFFYRDLLWVAGKNGLVLNWLWDNLFFELNHHFWVENSFE